MPCKASRKYSIYLPRSAILTRNLGQKTHHETFPSGVATTMAAVREQYWFPKLQSQEKLVRSRCYSCKRFSATLVASPAPGQLPEIIGTDFVRYKQNRKTNRKAKFKILKCSLSGAVHLELLPSCETEKYFTCLRRLIAHQGRPRIIYSDYGGTNNDRVNYARMSIFPFDGEFVEQQGPFITFGPGKSNTGS